MENNDLYLDFGKNLYKVGRETMSSSEFLAENISGSSYDSSSVDAGYLQSAGFSSGSTGWQLSSGGTIEANEGHFRGDITGASGSFTGTITATLGSIGGWSISSSALYYNGVTDSVSAGMVSADYPFYAGKKYADRATAPFRVTPAGVMYATGAIIDGTSTIGGISGTQIGYVSTSTADIVPTGLSCSSTTAVVASDGSVSSSVVLTWNAISTNTFDYYQIRFKKAAATYYTYVNSKTNTITIEGLVPNLSYNFGIASVNKYGSISAFSADISQTTATSATAPATVAGVTATGGIQCAIIEFTASTASDLSHYNIYRNTINDSATATKIASVKTTYFVDGNLTA